jgi:hypothetical protein
MAVPTPLFEAGGAPGSDRAGSEVLEEEVAVVVRVVERPGAAAPGRVVVPPVAVGTVVEPGRAAVVEGLVVEPGEPAVVLLVGGGVVGGAVVGGAVVGGEVVEGVEVVLVVAGAATVKVAVAVLLLPSALIRCGPGAAPAGTAPA